MLTSCASEGAATFRKILLRTRVASIPVESSIGLLRTGESKAECILGCKIPCSISRHSLVRNVADDVTRATERPGVVSAEMACEANISSDEFPCFFRFSYNCLSRLTNIFG